MRTSPSISMPARRARRRASQRSIGSTALNVSGLIVIEAIATATTMSSASAGTTFRSRASVIRMNENSPIWPSASPTVIAVRVG